MSVLAKLVLGVGLSLQCVDGVPATVVVGGVVRVVRVKRTMRAVGVVASELRRSCVVALKLTASCSAKVSFVGVAKMTTSPKEAPRIKPKPACGKGKPVMGRRVRVLAVVCAASEAVCGSVREERATLRLQGRVGGGTVGRLIALACALRMGPVRPAVVGT